MSANKIMAYSLFFIAGLIVIISGISETDNHEAFTVAIWVGILALWFRLGAIDDKIHGRF